MTDREEQKEPVTLDTLLQYMLGLDERLRDHMTMEENGMRLIREELGRLSRIVGAFPVRKSDGQPDIEGHRADHETRIEDAEVVKKRMDGIKATIIEKVISGIFYALVFLLFLGVKDYFSHPISAEAAAKIIVQGQAK